MSDSAWFSPVQILDSALLGASFSMNAGYSADAPVLTMTVTLQTERPDKQGELNLGRCVFGFIGVWHEPDNQENSAYTINCSMGITVAIPDGAFEEGFSDERKARVVDANAVSLVYGKIRSFIEDLTVQSPVGRQTIPAIEPYALLRSLEEKQAEDRVGEPEE